ncbi:uncharacterized protein LOC129236223 [Anastrepha obliqua]|uniref:uncharacterized protein LOC129236223 n=1 Tax=Anastrepha obliqua TaxID=95512 RepID=UPI002409523E|nr:uncharacterized protein LOC129236223 [Anastrepha obliqua]
MSRPLKRKIHVYNTNNTIKTTPKNVTVPETLSTNAAAAAVAQHTATDLEIGLPTVVIRQPEGGAGNFAVSADEHVSRNAKPFQVTAVTSTAATTASAVASTSTKPSAATPKVIRRVAVYSSNVQKNIESGAELGGANEMGSSTREVATQATTAHLDAYVIDMQKSDSDDDGYSNIDFNDDDYQFIDSEECLDEYDPAWSPTLRLPCKVFNYKEATQQSLRSPAGEAPIFYFDLLLGPRAEFFSKLANSCGIRATKTMENPPNIHTFSSEEMQIFIGICLQMSALKLFDLAEYWSESANFGFDGFGDKMSLQRFETILDILNFDMFKSNSHNPTVPSSSSEKFPDTFSNIRPLLNYFNTRMESVYISDRRLILNDPLIYWKGKFDWLNEVQTKLRRYAVGLHFLTEPSGLLLKIVADLEVPERKQITQNSKALAFQRSAIALELLEAKLRKGHIVYASKHYGSYALALELAKQQTYCTGLLDCNRFGNSKEVILTPLDKGCVVARYAGDIMMGKYRHRGKNIYFYSSNCADICANEQEDNESPLANVVKELNTLLCQATKIRSDMLNCQMLLSCEKMKWDQRLMIYVMNLIVLNAYILYTKHAVFRKGQLPIQYEKFRQVVIASLLNTNLENEHTIQIIPPINDKVVKKRCLICRKGGLVTYSKYSCKICPGLPGLCATPCFKIWHDQLQKSMLATKAQCCGKVS